MTIQFKGGRLPNDPTKPRLHLSTVLKAVGAPTYPPVEDYLSKVASWPMYLNDQLGDCTCAAMGHIVESMTTYGQGSTVKVSDNDVLKAYEAVSGYNPSTGANDNGAVVQDVLNYWRKTGIAGHKILAFASVDVKNLNELRTALSLFGTLYLGINFPNTAMDQFNNGQPWDVVAGAQSEGGHAINGGYYNVDTNEWKIVTWGAVQTMTQAFWDKYVEEAWVVITPEWFNAQGKDPAGIDMYSLGQQFHSMTGEANPFPAPSPTPTPEPGPNPVPVGPTPLSPDDTFAAIAAGWLNEEHFFYKKLQREIAEWLRTR